MFYKSKATLQTALKLMVNHPEKIELMATIKEALDNVNPETVDDAYDRKILKMCKSFSSAMAEKGIYTTEQARLYFDNIELDDDLKSIVNDEVYFNKEILNDFMVFFHKVKIQPRLEKAADKFNTAWTNFESAGVSNVQELSEKLENTIDNLSVLRDELASTRNPKNVVIIDPKNDKVIGKERVKEKVLDSFVKVKTGMWMDHVTGGGFRPGLYVVGSISGGFKSGWMQNMAEFMSLANTNADLKVPTGMTGAILYINLELMEHQMMERKMSFYGKETDEYATGDKDMVEDAIKISEENGIEIPVIYQANEKNYPIASIKQDIQMYEKMGYYIVALVVDYLDRMKYDARETDEAERVEPLVSKAESLRDLGKAKGIPVLTGIQLNRDSAELKKNMYKAHTVDLLKFMASDKIAKAFNIINVPEQLYFCYKFGIPTRDDEFFSLIVDKDRDGLAKYINPEGKKENNRYGRVHYVSRLTGNPARPFQISNQYSDTITAFDLGIDSTVINTLSVSDEEEEDL